MAESAAEGRSEQHFGAILSQDGRTARWMASFFSDNSAPKDQSPREIFARGLWTTATQARTTQIKRMNTIGITAGASAPESLVEDVVAALGERYQIDVSEVGKVRETVNFKLPSILAS